MGIKNVELFTLGAMLEAFLIKVKVTAGAKRKLVGDASLCSKAIVTTTQALEKPGRLSLYDQLIGDWHVQLAGVTDHTFVIVGYRVVV